jgi:hypothetical protein
MKLTSEKESVFLLLLNRGNANFSSRVGYIPMAVSNQPLELGM